MADISLSNLTKRYGDTQVLHGIDLMIGDGEFVVLVGPSGCGKSTTLRMVAGLEDISDGTVSIGGRVVNNLEPKDRDIAMVFQNYAIYPHMTVRKNIGFGLRAQSMPRADKERRIDEVAELLDMTPLLDRKPSQLSGGQRQRVRHRARHGPRPGRVPVRRTPVQPGRSTAHPDAVGNQEAARPGQIHHRPSSPTTRWRR